MKLPNIEYHKKNAMDTLSMLDRVHVLENLDIPGRFVLSAPANSRIVVSTLSELHEARMALRESFGWTDTLNNKFYSSGVVIVTYRPGDDVVLPFPFELWVEASPAVFPIELLGDCELQLITTMPEYTVVCPIKGGGA